MATFEVDIHGATYQVDAPDEKTAWKWANATHTQQPEVQQKQARPEAQPSTMQKVQASIPGRMAQGMRDPIDQAASMLPKGLEAITSLGGYAPNTVSKFFGTEASRVQDINQKNEADYQAARTSTGNNGMDISRFSGNVLSPVNLAAALRVGPALSVGAKAAQGAGMGAMGGALANEDVNSPDYWKSKLVDTAGGAAFGAAIPSVVGGAARVIRPETNQKAAALLKQGITPTPGQVLGGVFQTTEDKLQSVPLLGDMITAGRKQSLNEFNKTALNRALSPIGEQVDKVGREGVLQVKNKLSAAYDRLLPNISFTPDGQFTAEMGALDKMAQGLGGRESDKFNSIMADVMSKASPNGSMTGETFKIVESKLNNEAKKFVGSTDAYQKELGDALTQALAVMRNTLPRVNPKYSDQLSKINEGYANYARIRTAAASTATGARDGVFTPAQLATAIKGADKTAGKGASATGKALMQDLAEQGTNILGSKYPDSGTTGRALLGSGALASAMINPAIPAALAVAGLPFIGAGRKASAALLTKRPAEAVKLATLLRKTAPALAGGVPFSVLGNQP